MTEISYVSHKGNGYFLPIERPIIIIIIIIITNNIIIIEQCRLSVSFSFAYIIQVKYNNNNVH